MSIVSFIISLVFVIPFVIAGIVITYTGLKGAVPVKLRPSYVSPQSHIEDNAGCITETNRLEGTLKAFEQKTGICPYVLTVNNSDWAVNYTSLESFAYTSYLERFSDEQHFLVVYSEPENGKNSEFNDWFWEGMQGDDTDAIISETHFRKFQTALHAGLARKGVSVEDAFSDAFSDSLSYMMKPGIPTDEYTLEMLVFALIWDIFVTAFLISLINSWINSRRTYYDASGTPVSGTAGSDIPRMTGGSAEYSGVYSSGSRYGGQYGGSRYGAGQYVEQNSYRSPEQKYDVSHIGFDQPSAPKQQKTEMDEISFDDYYGQSTYDSSNPDSYQGPEIK